LPEGLYLGKERKNTILYSFPENEKKVVKHSITSLIKGSLLNWTTKTRQEVIVLIRRENLLTRNLLRKKRTFSFNKW
jgi:hypothetical protein